MTKTVRNSKSKQQHNLEQLFKSIIKFFKSQSISSSNKQKLATLPWFLVVGQPESGKTELLSGAEQKYIFCKKNQPEKKRQCSWWVTKEAVYLNIPGNLLLSIDKGKSNASWKRLVKLLKKNRKHCPISGILLILDSQDMLSRSDVSNHFRSSQLAHALHDLAKLGQNPIPIHLILSKCDLIPGFISFFADQGKEYREQPWGFELENDTVFTSTGTNEGIITEFNCLIKQLNKQLLWHLHHEANENKRLLIKAFPLQIEQVKSKLSGIINGLKTHLSHPAFTLKGVFLCSSKQYGIIDAALGSPSPTHDQHKSTPTNLSRHHFTRELFTRITQRQLHTPIIPRRKVKRGLQIITLLCCIVLIVTTVIYLSKQFSSNMTAISKANSALAAYQTELSSNHSPNIQTAIDLLNDIAAANQYINQSQPQITHFVFNYNHSLEHSINETKEYALYHVFVPALKNHLSDYLTTHENNPGQLYIGLKIYLMLGNEIPMDKNYIKTHLNQLFSETPEQSKLSKQTTALLLKTINHSFKPITVDKTLTTDVRDQLNNLQPSELAYIILFSDVEHDDILINDLANADNNVFNIDPTYQRIPAIYTANEFKQVFPDLMEEAVNAVIKGNNVLGKPKHKRPVSEKQLNRTLKSIYLKEYAATWVSLIEHIKLKPMTDFSDITQAAKQLSNIDSPMLKLLSIVRENTNFNEVRERNEQLAEFVSLLDNLSNPKTSLLFQIFTALDTMSPSSEQLSQSNPQELAFQTVKRILADSHPDQTNIGNLKILAKKAPEPIRGWLEEIANSYWKLAINSAGDYINEQWKVQILTPYSKHLANKYPLKKSSETQLSLNEFNQFFNKEGLLERFEENYIFPFISYKDNNWQVKPEVAKITTIPKVVLEQLKRFAHIQAMYFTHDGQSVYSKFSLQPISADPDIQSFKLTLGKSGVLYNPNLPNVITNLEWPSSTGDTVQIELITDTGKPIHQTFNGTWDWPKLVNQYSAIPLAITDQQFDLVFNIENHSIKFRLINSGSVNPYALDYIQKTWMPRWIFKS
jgi:type VI secretion system protein ImpL